MMGMEKKESGGKKKSPLSKLMGNPPGMEGGADMESGEPAGDDEGEEKDEGGEQKARLDAVRRFRKADNDDEALTAFSELMDLMGE